MQNYFRRVHQFHKENLFHPVIWINVEKINFTKGIQNMVQVFGNEDKQNIKQRIREKKAEDGVKIGAPRQSRQLKNIGFATQIMLGSIFMLP